MESILLSLIEINHLENWFAAFGLLAKIQRVKRICNSNVQKICKTDFELSRMIIFSSILILHILRYTIC